MRRLGGRYIPRPTPVPCVEFHEQETGSVVIQPTEGAPACSIPPPPPNDGFAYQLAAVDGEFVYQPITEETP